MSLVIAKSILGEDLKKAKFIRPIKNQRTLDGNRVEEIEVSLCLKFSEILGIAFNTISHKEHFSSPAKLIEVILKRRSSPKGQTLFMTVSDIYCRFGFKNYTNFYFTKHKLKNLWREIDYTQDDQVYGFFLEETQTNLRCKVSNIEIDSIKNLLKEITFYYGYIFSSILTVNNNKRYLLVCPYRHDRISENFSRNFFEYVNTMAEKKKLNVIIKNHPNDTYDYTKYLSSEKDIINLSDKFERHIPVELFLQSKQVVYTVSVPSSSLAFAETNRLSVLVPKNRSLYRKKFLDQEPFLNRLKINVKTI